MLEKSYRNKSIIPLGFFVVLGATMAFAILLQSPPLAFADDLSEGVTDATQTDVPVVVPSPAPPTTDISPAPVAPVESVAGGGAATGSIAVAPPAPLARASTILACGANRAIGGGSPIPADASPRDGKKLAARGISSTRETG